MKKQNFILSIVFLIASLLMACSSGERVSSRTDTPTSGVARIVVDECLAPVVQQQVDVFGGTYPDATILPVYTSEIEAYRLFSEDSIRVIIGTRELSSAEIQGVKDRQQHLRSQRLAYDGIALVINKNNSDTLITIDNVRKIMTGEIRSWKELNKDSQLGDITVVFDTPNSSTARFIRDSITGDTPFGEHVNAIADDIDKTGDIKYTPNQQVVNYVKQNKNALGVVGVNWISNSADAQGLSFSSSINVMSISNNKLNDGKYYKPYSAFLVLGWYPLSRSVYIIITDPMGGLPSGFVNFAAGEKGQRIVNKSGLYPATVPTRLLNVNPL